jgi:hypothetical protein
MPQPGTIVLDGYSEFLRACKQAPKETEKQVRETFRTVGRSVERGASVRIAPHNARTAAGYKTRVRARGIAVEQTRRKTTGHHPEWGGYQMRHALMPALEANETELVRDLEEAMGDVARHFEKVPRGA